LFPPGTPQERMAVMVREQLSSLRSDAVMK
jgi:hypothetical protein